MSDNRPAIPAELERQLMLESGYRCAICKTPEPLQIEHIVEWSKVRVHEFANMIVLCANCHGRKKNTSDARHINQASLKKIKSDLMLLNGRYSDLERRIIEEFQKQIAATPSEVIAIFVPEAIKLLVNKLISDGLVSFEIYQNGMTTNFPNGVVVRYDTLRLILTQTGREFIGRLVM